MTSIMDSSRLAEFGGDSVGDFSQSVDIAEGGSSAGAPPIGHIESARDLAFSMLVTRIAEEDDLFTIAFDLDEDEEDDLVTEFNRIYEDICEEDMKRS